MTENIFIIFTLREALQILAALAEREKHCFNPKLTEAELAALLKVLTLLRKAS